MENMTLQQLVTSTQEALTESHASGYYQKVWAIKLSGPLRGTCA